MTFSRHFKLEKAFRSFGGVYVGIEHSTHNLVQNEGKTIFPLSPLLLQTTVIDFNNPKKLSNLLNFSLCTNHPEEVQHFIIYMCMYTHRHTFIHIYVLCIFYIYLLIFSILCYFLIYFQKMKVPMPAFVISKTGSLRYSFRTSGSSSLSLLKFPLLTACR